MPLLNGLSAALPSLILLAIAAPSATADRHAQRRQSSPTAASERAFNALDLIAPHHPAPVSVEDAEFLIYELHVTNFARAAVSVLVLQVLDADTGRELLSLSGEALVRSTGTAGSREAGSSNDLDSGRRSIVFLSVPTLVGAPPRALRHRMVFQPGSGGDPISVTGGEVLVAGDDAAALGAPLRGGPWRAVYAPEAPNGHRRVLYAVAGKVRAPGRHAVDWMPAHGFQPASTGQQAVADGVGADVLAVTDGVIVAVRADFPDRGAAGPAAGVEDETGNMIVLDPGDGRLISYQHLAQDVRVRPGDQVRRGDVIGQVGASGHVTRPHLHFSVSDSAAPLSGEGLPYRLNAGSVLGRYGAIGDFASGRTYETRPPEPLIGMPAPNAVVVFD